MSLFDTFDPNSEELIKVNMQRSFRKEEDLPEVVIRAFKEETFRALEQVASAEVICSLRGGRTIPVYRVHWQGRDVGLFHTLMGGAGTVCLMESLIARGAKAFLFYGNCGVLNKEIAAGHLILPTGMKAPAITIFLSATTWRFLPMPIYRRSWMNSIYHMSPAECGQLTHFTVKHAATWRIERQMAALQSTWNAHPLWRQDSSVVCQCTSFCMRTTAWTVTIGIHERWAQGRLPATKCICGWRWRLRQSFRGSKKWKHFGQNHGKPLRQSGLRNISKAWIWNRMRSLICCGVIK